MEKKISIYTITGLLLLISLLSVTTPHTDTNRKDNLIFSDKIVAENGDSLSIFIYQDDFRNIILKLFSMDKYLCGSSGAGNSELIKSTPNIINKIHLDPDSISEYYIGTYTYGSTYGAINYFIIWYNNHSWEVTKTPFERPYFEDIDQDGIFEIVEYFNSTEGKQYMFQNGSFNRITK